jgi:peptide deformylase
MTKLKGKKKAKARRKKIQNKQMSKTAYRTKMLSMLLKYDNEILSQECKTVPKHNSDVLETIAKMKKVLGFTDNGVGLAASQIGILERVIVIRPDSRKYEIKAMINPEIIEHSEHKKYGIEGCLSYPKIYSPIERYTSITVKYFDENWKEHIVEYKEGEIEGIIFQHELEHLSEGDCQIHDWWKDPEGMKAKLQEVFEAKKEESTGGYDVEESEDLQKENEEEPTQEDE